MNPIINKDESLFDIEKICKSGQIFRWKKERIYNYINNQDVEIFTINAFINKKDRSISIVNYPNFYEFLDVNNEFEEIWVNYFDLSFESNQIYEKFNKLMKTYNDPEDKYLMDKEFLIKCQIFGEGIRILNQDPWEVLISFIISQNNSIPRITNSINKICELNKGKFPTPNELLTIDLSECSLGYRQKYIKSVAENVIDESIDLNFLKFYKPNELRLIINDLKSINGVGDKVANCIALFGYHFLNAFPNDTWINRILEHKFKHSSGLYLCSSVHDEFCVLERSFAGLTQQYMYYYALNHKSEFK